MTPKTTRPAHSCFAALALAALAALVPAAAPAALVTASYAGNVTGYQHQASLLAEYPVGTPFSWEFTFDDSFRAGGVFVDPNLQTQAITGWAAVAGAHYELTSFYLSGAFLDFSNGDWLNGASYVANVSGAFALSGVPTGQFLAFQMRLDPLMTVLRSPRAVFTGPGGLGGGWLELSGSGTMAPAAVPTPSTAVLVLSALAMLGLARRGSSLRRSSARSTDGSPQP